MTYIERKIANTIDDVYQNWSQYDYGTRQTIARAIITAVINEEKRQKEKDHETTITDR
jgi:hypothetical protein